jgi:hypothetical protein
VGALNFFVSFSPCSLNRVVFSFYVNSLNPVGSVGIAFCGFMGVCEILISVDALLEFQVDVISFDSGRF